MSGSLHWKDESVLSITEGWFCTISSRYVKLDKLDHGYRCPSCGLDVSVRGISPSDATEVYRQLTGEEGPYAKYMTDLHEELSELRARVESMRRIARVFDVFVLVFAILLIVALAFVVWKVLS